jgi:acyl-CoA thioesterase FadM
VYRTLRVGDDLTVTVHLDLPPRDIERRLRFREDGQLEGEGILEPTADLLPLISSMSEHFRRQVQPGDVLTVLFQVQRL